MTPQKFRAIIETEKADGGHFIRIPFDVPKTFGARGRVKVKGTLNGIAFRGSLFPYGRVFYLGLNKTVRTSAKIKAGDMVRVTLEKDNITSKNKIMATKSKNKSSGIAMNADNIKIDGDVVGRDKIINLQVINKPQTIVEKRNQIALEMNDVIQNLKDVFIAFTGFDSLDPKGIEWQTAQKYIQQLVAFKRDAKMIFDNGDSIVTGIRTLDSRFGRLKVSVSREPLDFNGLAYRIAELETICDQVSALLQKHTRVP